MINIKKKKEKRNVKRILCEDDVDPYRPIIIKQSVKMLQVISFLYK